VRIAFWGVRGSITTPEVDYSRYGGNTPCVAARLNDGTVISFDAGMGFRWMTLDLMGHSARPQTIALLLTHCHWDHIQGIPFSPMMYVRGYRVDIYGRGGGERPLREAILRQMDPAYCPVPNFLQREDVGADVVIHDIGRETFSLGPARVTARALPRGRSECTGWRVENAGKVVAYMSDLEYKDGPASCAEAIELARGADLLIHDAQFLPEEREQRRGWGHSTYQDAIELGRLAGARRVALFHHDPARTDDQLDAIMAQVDSGCPQVFAAREGLDLEL
ncbi:MAG: MBL fold metallo-hydrolase, partial [Candidatus Eremiobacterota bacterium]